MWDKSFSLKRKERIKVIKTIIQIILLVCLIFYSANALFEIKKYKPVAESERTYNKGFITLSYFGVDRCENGALIDDNRLKEHLAAIKASGYKTITQKDIYDYYKNGKKLPEKALYLIFEDGRRDSALFAQKIMEKLNYKSTMFTYANKFEMNDSKFFTQEQLLELLSGTYWDLGTNGYRLEYINVFDRYNKYLGVLTSNEFTMLSYYIDENYNHYLMDFIKDEEGIPIENRDEMTKRLSYDYNKLKETYMTGLSFVPNAYILMHSNTLYYGSNPLVGAVNQKWIYNLFQMCFNREGDSLNKPETSIYDLTRMQPQSYWYTNHLLMRIWDDTKNDMAFVSGDTKRKAYWDTTMGESEFRQNNIILTSLPKDRGFMRLRDSEDFKDVNLSVNLDGNKVGSQSIYLRSDKKLSSYIKIEITNNILHIIEKNSNKQPNELFLCNLRVLDGITPQSIDENKLETEIQENKTIIKYSQDIEEVKQASYELNEQLETTAPTVDDNAEAYIPEIGISEKGSRKVNILLKDSNLTVLIDGKTAIDNMELQVNQEGYLCLESAFGGYGYSHRNITDDVYDGVFKDLVVKQILQDSNNKILYDNRIKGYEKLMNFLSNIFNSIVTWFIETF